MRDPLLHRLWEALVAEPEAPKTAVFGQYLFAPARDDVPTPKELNTEPEEEFLSAVTSWIDLDSAAKLKRIKDKIIAAMAKGEYKPLLDPGNIRVYRGLVLNRNKAQSVLGVIEDGWNAVNTPGTLKPLPSLFQSWTASSEIATNFSGIEDYEEGTVSVVLYARTTDAGNMFFGKPGRLGAVVDRLNGTTHAQELEVISVGPVQFEGFVCYAEAKKKAGRREEEGWGKTTKHLKAEMLKRLP